MLGIIISILFYSNSTRSFQFLFTHLSVFYRYTYLFIYFNITPASRILQNVMLNVLKLFRFLHIYSRYVFYIK